MKRPNFLIAPGLRPNRPILLIAPGLSLFLVGALMLVALTGFRHAPGEAEVRVANDAAARELLPALITSPNPEYLPQVIATALGLTEVSGVAQVRSGTRWITAWAADGAAPRTPAPGYAIPIDAAAVDPEMFHPLVPAPLQETVLALAGGGAILSRTGAALRGISEHGSLQFKGGIDIPVVGVVDDHVIRNHEMVVSHQTGLAIGLNRTAYLAIGLNDLSAGKAVEEAIRGAIPPEASMRVRGPDGSGASSAFSPLLSLAEIKFMFGEFAAVAGSSPGIRIEQPWIDTHTEMTTIPLLGTFRCHKRVIPQIAAAFEEVQQAGLGYLIRGGDFGGCFSPRFIRSGNEAGLSRHAWAIAFDFNVSTNLYGQQPTMDARIVEIMERHGFSWGGRWNYPDGMHFEFVAETGR